MPFNKKMCTNCGKPIKGYSVTLLGRERVDLCRRRSCAPNPVVYEKYKKLAKEGGVDEDKQSSNQGR